MIVKRNSTHFIVVYIIKKTFNIDKKNYKQWTKNIKSTHDGEDSIGQPLKVKGRSLLNKIV